MRLRDARAQIEREHPELTGSAKLEAIKALRQQAATEAKEPAPAGASHCPHCDQQVKPVQMKGWQNFLAWVALLQAAAVVAAIVNAISPVDPDSAGGGVGRLILWPAAVDAAWMGIVAALAAFFTAAALTGAARERTEKTTTCSKCGQPLTEPQA